MEPDDRGRVEEAISQMSRGRMSQEARERLFDQVAVWKFARGRARGRRVRCLS